MTGPELKAIRHRLGLSTTALGRAFGYEGSDVTASGTIRKYESDARAIPPWLARLAIMFDRFGVPDGWTELNSSEEMKMTIDEKSPGYIAAAEHVAMLSRDGLYAGETLEVRPAATNGENAGGYEVVKRVEGNVGDIVAFDPKGQQVW